MTPCVVCSKKRDEKRDDQCGLVCFRCSNRILRYLRELEEYLPTLSLEKGSTGSREYQRPVFGSRSPANDTVIFHTDPRSQWDDLDGNGALAVVGSWGDLVAEERGIRPALTAFLAIGLLRRNHDWITQHPWVDEYAAELKQVHAAVRALAHDPVQKSQGKCIRFEGNVECRGDVFELDDASGVRCSKNKNHVYSGLDLVRFRASQEAG